MVGKAKIKSYLSVAARISKGIQLNFLSLPYQILQYKYCMGVQTIMFD